MKALKPPIEEPLEPVPYRLVVEQAIDTPDGVKAAAWVQQDAMRCFSGTVLPGSAGSRKFYIKDALAKEPALDPKILDSRLIQLGPKLAQALQALGSAPAAAPQPPRPEDELLAAMQPLLALPNVLQAVVLTLRAKGVVGEQLAAQLLYLAFTARVQQRKYQVSCEVRGPSSAGKSWLVEQVAALMPAGTVHFYTSVSGQYLYYAPEPLAHKIIYIAEADQLAEESPQAMAVRSLLSEGKLVKGTVDPGPDGRNEGHLLVREGPTELVVTTTQTRQTDRQLDTRMHGIWVTTTAEQTQAIMQRQGREAASPTPEPDVSPLVALQEWLASYGQHEARVPYAPLLAQLTDHAEIRMRRDFPRLLSLIMASALVHQHQRGRSPDGAVEASIVDYRIVHALVHETYTAVAQGGLTKPGRETYAVLAKAVAANNNQPVTLSALYKAHQVAHIDVAKSTVDSRVKTLRRAGYVVNTAPQGLPPLYTVGLDFPPEQEALPSPEKLWTEWQGTPPPWQPSPTPTPSAAAATGTGGVSPATPQNGPTPRRSAPTTASTGQNHAQNAPVGASGSPSGRPSGSPSGPRLVPTTGTPPGPNGASDGGLRQHPDGHPDTTPTPPRRSSRRLSRRPPTAI